MSGPKHRYRVVEVGEGVTAVKVGDVLVMPWHGKEHALQVERRGEVSYLCTVTHIERVAEEPPSGKAQP